MPSRKRKIASKRVTEFIRQTFDGLPIVDASEDLRIILRHEDFAGARQKDFAHCVFARACKRQFGSSKVAFGRFVAYVEIPADDGTERVERYLIDRPGRQVVRDFDRGETVNVGASFWLRAPCPSETLDARRERSRKARLRVASKRQAIFRGTIESDENQAHRRNKYTKPKTFEIDVRLGTGVLANLATRNATVQSELM